MKILAFGGGSDMAKALPSDAILFPREECDVLNQHQIEKVLLEYKPDVVVNFAGIWHFGTIKDQDSVLWEHQVKVNLIGSYHVAKACVANGIKTIILIASVAGKYGKAEHSAYCVSKAGVISLVQSLGMEKINAYAISPGRVDTKMRERAYPGEDKRTRLQPKDIIKAIMDCINGKYKSGDNIIVRKRGFRKMTRIDRGEPWKTYLNVQPIGTPKTI